MRGLLFIIPHRVRLIFAKTTTFILIFHFYCEDQQSLQNHKLAHFSTGGLLPSPSVRAAHRRSWARMSASSTRRAWLALKQEGNLTFYNSLEEPTRYPTKWTRTEKYRRESAIQKFWKMEGVKKQMYGVRRFKGRRKGHRARRAISGCSSAWKRLMSLSCPGENHVSTTEPTGTKCFLRKTADLVLTQGLKFCTF